MDLNKIKAAAQKQLQDPKRRAQAQKLLDTAKDKVETARGKVAARRGKETSQPGSQADGYVPPTPFPGEQPTIQHSEPTHPTTDPLP